MGMISSRQEVLSRTSRTGVQSKRSWGSKGIRMGVDPRRFPGSGPGMGCFQGILTQDATIFEEHFCRRAGKGQAQTRFPTATSEELGILKFDSLLPYCMNSDRLH